MTGPEVIDGMKCALSPALSKRSNIHDHLTAVLASPPVRALQDTLGAIGLTIEPIPILHKMLTRAYLRVIFPVNGNGITEGAVVSVVCLHDVRVGHTLYAHPMHAGPGINPFLKHLYGPMASPKSQAGDDGIRAALRIVEHKRALWDRFGDERVKLGEAEAGRRWRRGYYWALKRLYFCSRCTRCRWGNPFFDGPDPAAPRKSIVLSDAGLAPVLSRQHECVLADVLASDAWQVESRYAQRGGYALNRWPGLVKELSHDHVQMVFPSNATLIQAGTLMAAAVMWHRPSRRVVFSHCLCAGPEAEIQFLEGGTSLGLPPPQEGPSADAARSAYRSWRSQAWSQFWLDELEDGIESASSHWFGGFWSALEALFGGNDIVTPAPPSTTQHSPGKNPPAGPLLGLGQPEMVRHN
ncbi:MAG: hypothetical protein ACE5GE_16385 [Phycisphaerae bacterium]